MFYTVFYREEKPKLRVREETEPIGTVGGRTEGDRVQLLGLASNSSFWNQQSWLILEAERIKDREGLSFMASIVPIQQFGRSLHRSKEIDDVVKSLRWRELESRLSC